MFVDIHSHILPGIDDGAADIQASLDMLEMAEAEGDGRIILSTPHYICGSLKNNVQVVTEKVEELRAAAKENDINVRIVEGCEIFLSTEVPELLDDKELCTLAGSSYVLVEFPMMTVPEYADEVLYRIRLRGYKPVIAHPERNNEILGDPNLLYDFIRKGMYSQVNASSLKGAYGRRVRDTALELIQHNLVHFVASDSHTCRGRSPRLRKAYEIVRAEFGRDTADRLFSRNGMAVLENRELEADEPKEIKRGFMHSFQKNLRRLRVLNT